MHTAILCAFGRLHVLEIQYSDGIYHVLHSFLWCKFSLNNVIALGVESSNSIDYIKKEIHPTDAAVAFHLVLSKKQKYDRVIKID